MIYMLEIYKEYTNSNLSHLEYHLAYSSEESMLDVRENHDYYPYLEEPSSKFVEGETYTREIYEKDKYSLKYAEGLDPDAGTADFYVKLLQLL